MRFAGGMIEAGELVRKVQFLSGARGDADAGQDGARWDGVDPGSTGTSGGRAGVARCEARDGVRSGSSAVDNFGRVGGNSGLRRGLSRATKPQLKELNQRRARAIPDTHQEFYIWS